MFSLRYFARRFFPERYFGPAGAPTTTTTIAGAMSQGAAVIAGDLDNASTPAVVPSQSGRRAVWRPADEWVPPTVAIAGAMAQAPAVLAGSLEVMENEDWLLDLFALTDEALVFA